MIADRAALVDKMLASAEQSVLAVGWTVATAQASPCFATPIGLALREIVQVGEMLDFCATLSQSAVDAACTQNLRPRLGRGGVNSGAPAPALNTTTRDCTSGRRHRRRRAFFGVRASTPRTCE